MVTEDLSSLMVPRASDWFRLHPTVGYVQNLTIPVSAWVAENGLFHEGFPHKAHDYQYMNYAVADLTGTGKWNVIFGDGGYYVYAPNHLGEEARDFRSSPATGISPLLPLAISITTARSMLSRPPEKVGSSHGPPKALPVVTKTTPIQASNGLGFITMIKIPGTSKRHYTNILKLKKNVLPNLKRTVVAVKHTTLGHQKP